MSVKLFLRVAISKVANDIICQVKPLQTQAYRPTMLMIRLFTTHGKVYLSYCLERSLHFISLLFCWALSSISRWVSVKFLVWAQLHIMNKCTKNLMEYLRQVWGPLPLVTTPPKNSHLNTVDWALPLICSFMIVSFSLLCLCQPTARVKQARLQAHKAPQFIAVCPVHMMHCTVCFKNKVIKWHHSLEILSKYSNVKVLQEVDRSLCR